MNKVVLDWLMMTGSLKLLKLANGVWWESLFTLRSLWLNSSYHIILCKQAVCLRWQYKIVIDVHQPCNSLQKIGRWSPSHNKPPIVCCLTLRHFLTAAVKWVVHETGCPLRFFRLAVVHLLIDAPRRIVLLALRSISLGIICRTLPS